MSKKRKDFRKHGRKRSHITINKRAKNIQQTSTENIILQIICSSQNAVTPAELYDIAAQKNYKKREIVKAIDNLTNSGVLRKSKKKLLALHKNAPVYSGELCQHAKGFGFVSIDKSKQNPPPFIRDPFISRSNMGKAVHGDTVLIRILRTRNDNRPEATIIDITKKGSDTLCGIVEIHKKKLQVLPDDPRMPFTVTVLQSTEHVTSGDCVKVRINRETVVGKTVVGEIIEVLGKQDDIETQMRLVAEKFELPVEFSERALQEAVDNSKTPCPTDKKRKDLQKIEHITIDGETAKDFDDAICVEKTDNGFRLYVSIADVSHYVPCGSDLDLDAYRRGTSVYFPGQVIPMLPEILSNNACSLVPGEKRLTVTALLDFDSRGKLIANNFFRSQIVSKHRFTYTTVKNILTEDAANISEQHKPFIGHLRQAASLAKLLRRKRLQRGAIDFNLQEAQISLTRDGRVEKITKTERNFAHQMIEEFMLAANEAVASFLASRIETSLFRTHEPPDESTLSDYLSFLTRLGLDPKPFEPSPAWFAEILEKTRDTRYEYIINNLLLRSLKQASYSLDQTGHFGLASSAYTHFTSPIRRYPDLIVHRQLIAILSGDPENTPTSPTVVSEAASFLSKRERIAIDSERDMNERLKVAFMKDKIGQSFQALISGVNEKSIFITIEQLCISGGVPVELLDDDYYIFDSKNFRLFGEITAKTYQIGDRVVVELVDANTIRKKLSFKIVGQEW